MEKGNRKYTPGPRKRSSVRGVEELSEGEECCSFLLKAISSMRHSPQDIPAKSLLRVDWMQDLVAAALCCTFT
jgi:hypothetical protein